MANIPIIMTVGVQLVILLTVPQCDDACVIPFFRGGIEELKKDASFSRFISLLTSWFGMKALLGLESKITDNISAVPGVGAVAGVVPGGLTGATGGAVPGAIAGGVSGVIGKSLPASFGGIPPEAIGPFGPTAIPESVSGSFLTAMTKGAPKLSETLENTAPSASKTSASKKASTHIANKASGSGPKSADSVESKLKAELAEVETLGSDFGLEAFEGTAKEFPDLGI